MPPFQMAVVVIVYSEESIARLDIARILWRGQTEAQTRPKIRQLVHLIGQRLGRAVFETPGDMLSVRGSLLSDLQQYRAAVEQGRLLEAASHLHAGFADMPLRGLSGEFLDWRDGFAADLERRLGRVARTVWEVSSKSSDWPRARDAAEATYLLDPEDPEIAARVVEARARVGKVHLAEAAYAEYSERRPGQADPSESIEEVITRVRKLREESRGQGNTAEVPFVGRQEILEELTSVFTDVRSGVFSFVLIAGEAGIGKTRLLAELERAAHLDGIRCLRAQPVEMELRVPLNPIIDALQIVDLEAHLDALGEPWRTVIGFLLPPNSLEEPVGKPPPIDENNLPRRLLDAVSLLLERLAVEQPTVLFLDDLQWADATTIAALQFFQRRWSKSPFGVVATIRPGGVGPRNPVTHYLAEDGKLDVRRVELGELLENEARQLIQLVGDGRIDETAEQRLCALAGLHPLYLIELARDYLADRLRLPESSADAVKIPISLQQILAARTEGLSQDARRVADLLAVGSKPMRLTNISLLLALSLDDTADAAEELVQAGLVSLERGKAWITHDLFRSAIYTALNEPHRAILHHKIAEHLQATESDESAGELSTHYDQAGDPQSSAEYGWIAATRALERGAVAEAAHFYELVTRNEVDESRRAQATALLAKSLHQNRDIRRANPALELASSRLRAVGMLDGARRMDIRRVEGLQEAGHTPVNELVERLAAIKREARAEEDWEAVALALDVELHLLQLDEDAEGVRSLYPQFRDVIATGSQAARATAHLGLAVGTLADDPAGAVHSAQEAVRLTPAIGADQRLKAMNRLLIVFFHRGLLHLPENQPLIAEAQILAEVSGDLLQRFSFESNMGAAFMDAGDLDRAEALFAKADGLLGSADMTFPRINLAFNVGELALARGDFPSAATSFASAQAHLGRTIPRYTSDFVNAGLGLCALEMGSLSEARRREQALGDPPQAWYYDPTVILAFRSRLLERRGDSEQAVELLGRATDDLEDRLVMAWLKVRSLQVRLMLRAGIPACEVLAQEALVVCQELGLHLRVREFSELVARSARQ